MTRLEMQERIGAGPYTVYKCEDALLDCEHYCQLCDARFDTLIEVRKKHISKFNGNRLVASLEWDGQDNGLEAICDALNALWEAAS